MGLLDSIKTFIKSVDGVSPNDKKKQVVKTNNEKKNEPLFDNSKLV